jgi:hypothetical protein
MSRYLVYIIMTSSRHWSTLISITTPHNLHHLRIARPIEIKKTILFYKIIYTKQLL